MSRKVDLGQVVPIKGQDYFTTSEINDIENNVKEQVKTDLDFDNTIDGIESDIDDLQQEQTSQGNQIEQNKTDIDTINTKLVNYSLVTETGSKITLTIDNTNYQMYATLKDKNNNTINTSNVIDLPIEQLVMSVDYDNTTKEIVIELQNGEITRVPVGALISGLVSETQLETILGDYVKNTDYASSSKAGVVKVNTINATSVGATGNLGTEVKTYEQYQSMHDYMFIGKGTLENVIEGKGLVSNTDYAANDTAGVIKPNQSQYGTNVSPTTGTLYGSTIAYNVYQNKLDGYFISKGTLENVIIGKDLTTKAYVDGLVGDVESLLDTLDVGSGV